MRRAPRTAAPRRGFTLIEVLIAIGIVILLTSLLVMGMMGKTEQAKAKGTNGLILKIKAAMQRYHAAFRDFPPDGYDQEPPPPGGTGWAYTPQGVMVGTPQRAVKGTASLIYFLCRPLVKVTWLGDDQADSRNRQTQIVGPFLADLEGSAFSRKGFNPNHPWSDNAYWNNNYILTEIIDKFFRPLCYDKVKSNNAVYFQPARFHVHGGGSGTLPGGTGRFVHPDQAFMDNEMALLASSEARCPTDTHDGGEIALSGLTQAQLLQVHTDPRFTVNSAARAPDGCPLGNPFTTGFGAGTTATHEPKAQGGGYDLWSYGPSYINCIDDIGSWEN